MSYIHTNDYKHVLSFLIKGKCTLDIRTILVKVRHCGERHKHVQTCTNQLYNVQNNKQTKTM